MKITTKVTWDAEGNVLEHEYFDYDGPVASCKGDKVAQAAEKQQMDFNTQLMGVFKTQFASQSDILNYLNGKMKPIIEAGGQGYSPEALTAARTSAADTVSKQYQDAQKALQQQQFVNGGRDLPSGVNAQQNTKLAAASAESGAQAQNAITLENEQAKRESYNNAVNVLTGNAAQTNPLGYAGSATSGSGAIASLSTADTQRRNSGFLANLSRGVGTGLGQWLGGGGA